MTALAAPRASSLTLTFAALVGAAVAAGVAVLAVPDLGHSLYPHPPRPTLARDTGAALGLLAHNAPVALWPLALLALDWHEIPLARRAGDGLIGAQLTVHGATVGAALATWPELVPWLPHLPAEYAAIALPAGAWIAARRRGGGGRHELALTAALVLVLLALAAALETWAVPS